MTRPRPDMRGFTLLELIVAAAILALIAVFSWRGLDALVREREAIASSQADIDGLQRAFARLERDALAASDAELDPRAGAMRLVAGLSSVDGAPATTVEYRFVDGSLTRSVVGVDRAPLVLLDGIANLSMEAWLPAPRPGAWVRTKAVATEAPAVDAASGAARPQSGAAQTTSGAPSAQPPANPTPPVPLAAPVVAAASGIRVTFVRADGRQVVRAFMVGGG